VLPASATIPLLDFGSARDGITAHIIEYNTFYLPNVPKQAWSSPPARYCPERPSCMGFEPL
jgi:hypothetical protein